MVGCDGPYTERTPPSTTIGPATTVLWAAHVVSTDIHGNWQLIADGTAAGSATLRDPDAGAAKISTALADHVLSRF